MAKYEITNHEFYHAGGGTYLTICEVVLAFDAAELYSPSEIEEFKQAGEMLDDKFYRTDYIVVGCGYLNVYDRYPFNQDDKFRAEPYESFNLDDYEPTWLMEQFPGLDLYDYCDDYWFYLLDKDNKPDVHPSNLLFNTCCWLNKFEHHKQGYC